MTKRENKKPVRRSLRAGLTFPVGRVERYLRERRFARRVSSTAPIVLAGVNECVVRKILEGAIALAVASKKKRVTGHHVALAVTRGDEDLAKTFQSYVSLIVGGVVPESDLTEPRKPEPKKRKARSVKAAS